MTEFEKELHEEFQKSIDSLNNLLQPWLKKQLRYGMKPYDFNDIDEEHNEHKKPSKYYKIIPSDIVYSEIISKCNLSIEQFVKQINSYSKHIYIEQIHGMYHSRDIVFILYYIPIVST